MTPRLVSDLIAAGFSSNEALRIVDLVFGAIGEPDRDMLDAGLAELNQALGPVTDRAHGTSYRRDLVRVIWHAMLGRAR
jgi:hypothetical protein